MTVVAENDAEYCVTCPKCGKVNQKTFKTDSFIKCGKCGHNFYSYVDEGFSVSVDTAKYGTGKARNTILLYAKAFSNIEKVDSTVN